jgi:hypothetical protein
MEASGSRARPGMYFVKGTIGARPLTVRVMLLR